MHSLRYLILFLFTIVFFVTVTAQTIPVDNLQQDALLRLAQLKGAKDDRSFALRPLNSGYRSNDSINEQSKSSLSTFSLLNVGGKISALPLDWVQQYNSDHPYGWNDGALIPARGYQTLLSTGFYARWGIISMQLKPELVYAQNTAFQGFPIAHPDAIWAAYYGAVLNGIDNPERFGNGVYRKVFPGQSNIKLTVGKLSLAASSENLWWGPGIRNSIMMSNSAPGFEHISLNTSSPVHNFLGSFEFQLVGGKLNASGILPPDTNRTFNGNLIYVQKPNDWRYFSGVTIVWQPKWVKGLYLGLIRSIYEYGSDFTTSHGLLKFFPVFQKIFANGLQSATDNQDQLGSFFFRWVFPKNHAELYAEFARNDHSANLRDLILEPEHSRAYTVGLQKLISLNKPAHFIGIMSEITHMQIPNTYLLGRAEPTFYVHSAVLDGYTNEGQLLGAGIGPGSNIQTLDVYFMNGSNLLGLMLEQYDHNMDFYHSAFTSQTKKWSDISVTLHGKWLYKRFCLNGELAMVHSQNYEWWKISDSNFAPGYKDVTQLHAKIGVRYYW